MVDGQPSETNNNAPSVVLVGVAPSTADAERVRAVARNETARFLRFLVVGAGSFVVDTGSLSLFALGFGLDRMLAKGLAFALAVLSSFLGNYFWAYRDSRAKPLLRQVIEFGGVSLVGLGVNLSVFSLMDWACSSLFGPLISLYVAHASAVGAAMVWNFAANRLITYSDVRLGS